MQMPVKENKTLDFFKFFACILVVGAHIPREILSFSVDLYHRQWLIRFCVPFFFLSSGYFFYRSRNKLKSIKHLTVLFVVGFLLYLPKILASKGDGSYKSVLIWNAVFGYEHLWYISAALEGLLVWYVAEKLPLTKKLFQKLGLPAAVFLLTVGVLSDEYYQLLNVRHLTAFSEFLLYFGGPRNVIFFGFPMLMIGGGLARYEEKLRKIPVGTLAVLLAVSWTVSFGECHFLLEKLGPDISTDITFFNFWPAIFLFLLSFRIRLPVSEAFAKKLRKVSEYVYIIHYMIAGTLAQNIQASGILLWILTVVISVTVSLMWDNLLHLRGRNQ